MHPQLVAGAWVGFNDNRVTMGDSWGPGARSALPMVGDFFQQALRARWIDPKVEFDIPRPKPKPKAEPPNPLEQLVNEVLGRIVRILQ